MGAPPRGLNAGVFGAAGCDQLLDSAHGSHIFTCSSFSRSHIAVSSSNIIMIDGNSSATGRFANLLFLSFFVSIRP